MTKDKAMSKARRNNRPRHPSTYKLGDHPSCINHTTTPTPRQRYWQLAAESREQSERDLEKLREIKDKIKSETKEQS